MLNKVWPIALAFFYLFLLIKSASTKNGSKQLSARTVLYYINQPYGYFKVGNPIIKYSVIILMFIGVFSRDIYLVIQSAIIILVMLWLPFKTYKNEKISTVIIGFLSFGLAGFLKLNIPPNIQKLALDIPGYMIIDVLYCVNLLIMLIIFIIFAKSNVLTTMDFSWIVDIFKSPKIRMNFAGIVYSFAYGLLRFPELLENADIAIKSRGGNKPLRPSGKPIIERARINLSLWILYVFRSLEEMTRIIHYVITSRVKIRKREIPLWRYWATSDYCIAGMIFFSIFIPRILQF